MLDVLSLAIFILSGFGSGDGVHATSRVPDAAGESGPLDVSPTPLGVAASLGAECEVPVSDGEWTVRAEANHWLPGLYMIDARPPGLGVLTFDDGPMGRRTEALLDVLDEAGAHAVFFITGNAIGSSDYELIRRMVDAGHVVANHTYSHDTSMVRDRGEERTVAYIRWQYEAAQAMVDIALLAEDDDDFDAMVEHVFGPVGRHPSESRVREEGAAALERHAALLGERTEDGTPPYRMTYARPPGGSPYHGSWDVASYRWYAQATNELGLFNVLWHSATPDSDSSLPYEERMDVEENARVLARTLRVGGVVLAHDRMPAESLERALAQAGEEGLAPATLEALVEAKYGCGMDAVRRQLGWEP